MTTTTVPSAMTTTDPEAAATNFDATASDESAAELPRGPWTRRIWRGHPEDPAWARPTLLALLGATAVLYLWGLGASGWGNSYYAAAVQAGTKSWKAFFFGSFDSANFVTVDKSPAALWVMELSARLFGVNAWSILAPQAIEGVATVAVVYATVRRWFRPAAGLLAAAITALTPVAVLMFRFNNPDALLVLLLTLGAYGMTLALETGRTRWLVFAWSMVGFGFLAKMLQTLLVLPAFGVAYLLFGPPKFLRRVIQLVIATVAFLVSSLWWVVAVMVTPASSRPFIGGSENNSLWNLIFGYNGFGRLTGNERGSVGGGVGQNGATGMWGATGWYRMFNSAFGGQASWLLPCAFVLLVAGLVATVRRSRTDRTRAALVLWGGWLVVTAAAFSFGKGIIHEYYTVALAPAIGAVVAIGASHFWSRRHELVSRAVLVAALGVAVWWSRRLLERTPNWHPELRTLLLVGAVIVGAVLLITPRVLGRGAAIVALAAGGLGLAGSAAYAITTAKQPHSGGIVTAGPAGAGSRFGLPGGGRALPGGAGALRRFLGNGNGTNPFGNGGPPALGNGTNPFGNGGPPALGNPGGTGGPGTRPFGGGGGGGGGGGLLDASTPSAALTKALQHNASNFRWVAATIGANSAAGYQLGSGDAVMAIGGFNGTDPTPTLAQFEQYVQQGKIHYFISGGGFSPGGGGANGTGSQISAWVTSHYTAQTIGGTTVYDLTSNSVQ